MCRVMLTNFILFFFFFLLLWIISARPLSWWTGRVSVYIMHITYAHMSLPEHYHNNNDGIFSSMTVSIDWLTDKKKNIEKGNSHTICVVFSFAVDGAFTISHTYTHKQILACKRTNRSWFEINYIFVSEICGDLNLCHVLYRKMVQFKRIW